MSYLLLCLPRRPFCWPSALTARRPKGHVGSRAIACGGVFTAVNVAYLVAIEACRWRMHVHVKRAAAV